MRIRQLKLLVAVVDSETMSEAAASANLSTSAVSLQMKKLAQELKTELFFRSGKTLLPTPACRRLADQARQVIARFNVIEQEFRAYKEKREKRN